MVPTGPVRAWPAEGHFIAKQPVARSSASYIYVCIVRPPCPKAGSRPPYDGSHTLESTNRRLEEDQPARSFIVALPPKSRTKRRRGSEIRAHPPSSPPLSPVNPPLTAHSQPTAYRAHATQPTVPSAKRSQGAPVVRRCSARVGGSGAALRVAHPRTHVWAAPDGPAASAERGGPAAHGEAALSRAAQKATSGAVCTARRGSF